MKTAFKLAIGILALTATVAAAQDGRGRRGDGDGRGPGPGINRPGPGAGAPVIAPQRPVIVQRPAPVIVQRPIRRPVIVFTPPPAFPVWTRSFGYSERYHDTCQRKAWRLRWFERRAESDGYLSGSERAEISALRRDLRRTCSDFRWRG